MSIRDYLIDQDGLDWSALLRPWAWILPRKFTLWMVNRFGDLFLVSADGSVHWLDVGTGQLRRLANSRDDFSEQIDEDDNANNWLMIPLVDQLVREGIQLGPGQCYSYRTLPILGGDYVVENVVVEALEFHYAALGPIHEKLKDLPDGTVVKFK